jgi:hypothetical protein
MIRTPSWIVIVLAVSCGGEARDDAGSEGTTGGSESVSGSDGPSSSASAGPTTGQADESDDDGSSGSSGDTDDDNPPAVGCEPLPPPEGVVIEVGPDDDFATAIAGAPEGATVLLADGTYDVPAGGLWPGANGITLRSASGQRGAVVLDGSYAQTSGGLINIYGRRDVTIAHLSIRRARYHAIHVTGGPDGPSNGARLYDLHLADAGEQSVKINSNQGHDTDDGEVACSLIELTDAGREQVMMHESSGSYCYTGGIDAHRAWGWRIHDNVIRGFWCSNQYLSEHGVHMWRGCRDTIVERNLLVDNARGIGFGLGQPGPGRVYDDDPCPGIGAAEHYGGIIRNNMIVGVRPELFASPSGMDLGIGLEASCNATMVHNTVASTEAPYSSIEWRFSQTTARIINNLVTHNLRERDGATAQLVSNLENADAALFVDLASADLHLVPGADPAIDQGDPEGAALAPTDFDGDARDDTPDLGADERAG